VPVHHQYMQSHSSAVHFAQSFDPPDIYGFILEPQ